MFFWKRLSVLSILLILVVAIGGCAVETESTSQGPTSPSDSVAGSVAISGKVTDKSGKGIADASVSIGSPSISATTDQNGGFNVAVPAGEHTVTVSKTGYKTYSTKVSFNGETHTLNITLESQSSTGTSGSVGDEYTSNPWKGSWRYVCDTSNGGQLYDTYPIRSDGDYIRLRVTHASGEVRVQILSDDFTSTNLSEAKVEEQLKTRLLWQRIVTGPTTLYPKGLTPGVKGRYINLYKGSGVVFVDLAP